MSKIINLKTSMRSPKEILEDAIELNGTQVMVVVWNHDTIKLIRSGVMNISETVGALERLKFDLLIGE